MNRFKHSGVILTVISGLLMIVSGIIEDKKTKRYIDERLSEMLTEKNEKES